MNEYILTAEPRPIDLGASGRAEIEQNIRIIIATKSYSVRNDCPFADAGEYIDSPAPYHTARLIAALTEAIETYEPRVKVLGIQLAGDGETAPGHMADGIVFPRIRYAIKEGAL